MHRVLIVEDDPIAARLFELTVQTAGDFELSGMLASAALAEAWCLGHDVDLVLMDVVTAGHASGLEAASKLKHSIPRLKVLVVTSQPEVDFIVRAIAVGVDGFWYKTATDAELLGVMRRVMQGERVFPDSPPEVSLGDAFASELTPLEVRILRELTTGATNAQIARRLHLSDRTVGNNIQNMLGKTGFATRTMLAVAAVDSGAVISGV
ncbi:response regulator transcription factor [Olsenella urininfantis]|uniref:response regulator transcription factor n=1 Tax=Olsenella urininfantis TaxID=1871033 RepID=UPI000985DE55|nr:response regulator transcription factor [Olsenella urininfantis]